MTWEKASCDGEDEAFFWLEQSYREHAGQLYLLNVNPRLGRLRSDPRFTDLVRRIGLEK